MPESLRAAVYIAESHFIPFYTGTETRATAAAIAACICSGLVILREGKPDQKWSGLCKLPVRGLIIKTGNIGGMQLLYDDNPITRD